MISRSRGYLPHLECPQGTYFLTFRLEDSLPADLLLRWKEELQLQKSRRKNAPEAISELEREYRSKIEMYLDTNSGRRWLGNPKIAGLVVCALRFFDGQRYLLHAWTIMPNHVHVLFTASGSWNLSSIIHGWKSYTANEANRLLGRSGRFWQPEYFDQLIKSERQFEFSVRYILNNPVKAGLCKEAHQWPWSGCSTDIQNLVNRFS